MKNNNEHPPPPVLDYATPPLGVPGYLVVILYVWWMLGSLLGLFQSLLGLGVCGGGGTMSMPVGGLLILLGLGLVVWGNVILRLALQMRRYQAVVNQAAALRRAAILMIVGEVYAWIWVCLAVALAWEYYGSFQKSQDEWLVWLTVLFFAGIAAVPASVTRILLRQAAKRNSPWL